MAAQITKNQISYSNSFALLSVKATAARSDTEKITITAEWEIYTAGSSLASATRYLVLYVGSASGSKYYSAAIRAGAWNKETTYKGTTTFTVPLAADATAITIGFGVSASSNAVSTSGTLVWNGSNAYGDSGCAIQFGTITGIPVGASFVYIFYDAAWHRYVAYIHNGTTWRRYVLYIHNGSTWRKYAG